MNIEFVSYTGEYPLLCEGVLTVKIDGKEYKFGHEPMSYDFKQHRYPEENFDRFWASGGGIVGPWSDLHAVEGDWKLSLASSTYPDWLKPLFPELIKVFNEHVEHGCCGGCI